MSGHVHCPLRILSAEDVAINREILRVGLTRLGHAVEFAVNGVEALDKLQDGHFDLVLMDVQMPLMDGVEATRRIRQLPAPLRDMPVVGLTSNVSVTDLRAYASAGMNECLAKPIEWPRLANAIARYAAREVLLNRSQIESLRFLMGSAELGKLQSMALETLQGLADCLAAHLEIAAVKTDAHRVKGLAGTMGMHAIHRTASTIEAEAAEGRREAAAIGRLHQEVAATRQAIAAAGSTV